MRISRSKLKGRSRSKSSRTSGRGEKQIAAATWIDSSTGLMWARPLLDKQPWKKKFRATLPVGGSEIGALQTYKRFSQFTKTSTGYRAGRMWTSMLYAFEIRAEKTRMRQAEDERQFRPSAMIFPQQTCLNSSPPHSSHPRWRDVVGHNISAVPESLNQQNRRAVNRSDNAQAYNDCAASPTAVVKVSTPPGQ